MKKLLRKSLMVAAMASFPFLTMAQSAYTRYVNPFIGNADNGHTFPGACLPFGLVQPSPVTGAIGWQYCSEYRYVDKEIWGFSQTHLNGTGCLDLGNILLMPVTARPDRKNYRSDFDKKTETARPGYYSVHLNDAGVGVELTATEHVAFHRYTFEKTDSAGVFIDLQHGASWSEECYNSHVKSCEVRREDNFTISGHLRAQVWVDKDIYFVLTFNRPIKSIEDLPLQGQQRGNRMVVRFDMAKGEQLEAKVALSSASLEGARKNMAAELPGWNFDEITRRADRIWNNYLSRITVEGTEDQKTSFYTSFYHTMIQPNNIADVDGSYRDAKGNLAHAADSVYYSTFSLWDTYRAAHPFYTLVLPDKVCPFIRSMLRHADAAGYLPVWTLWGKENYCMIGNHSVPVIAEAYVKGFRDFDAEKAFAAIQRTQIEVHGPKSQWDIYMKYGYYPTDKVEVESVSRTLESSYDDYAAAVMAQLLGKKKDYKYFAERADFYKNVFDKQTGFMRPRMSDGQWKTPFDPTTLAHDAGVGGDYTEGNAWQYTWHVQHDVPGLIKLMGGKKKFVQKLDSVFTLRLEGKLADVTGLIGQYAHGNEPSHHLAYLYTMAGCPERTQKLVREIFETKYLAKPDGLCGNDDCGQMSAWYMFAAMGFYPVDPVSATYIIGAPQLPRVELKLANGKKFTMVAEGLSKEHLYVDKIYLNGRRYKKNYIRHADIVAGGELVFKMK